MDETKKYIIEFSEDPHTIRLLKLKNGDKYPVTEFKTVTPYTEPDLDAIRKESYDKCMNEAEDLAYKLYSPKIDEAYQRGLNDAREGKASCEFCGFTDVRQDMEPCASCSNNYDNKFEQEEMDGLRQNIQTIVDQCGYTLDEIAEVLQKMKENNDNK